MNRLIPRTLLVSLALSVGMPMARAADSAGDRADVRVRNHGVPGDNSRDALAGLPKILKGRPEHLVIFLGMNDAMNSKKLVGLAAFRGNLTSMVSQAQKANVRSILLVTIHPVNTVYLAERDPTHPQRQRLQEHLADYDAAVRQVAKETGAVLVDWRARFLAESPGESLEDAVAEHKDCLNLCVANSGTRNGNHPTARGYRFLADEVAQALRGRVKAGETVACVGDSLTYGSHMAGEGTATGTTYPALLAGMLRQTGTTALAVEPRYGPVNNVPEAADYTLLCSLMIPNSAKYNSTGVPYQIDHRAWLSEFRRVAYYMELQQGSEPVRFIWVSMDAFSPDAGKLGVPAAGVGASFTKSVTNLNVFSSVPGVTNGTGLGGGTIDFRSADSGVMRIQSAASGQTLFVFDHWGDSSADISLGIGSNPPAGHAASYDVKRFMAFVLPNANPAPVDADIVVYGGTSGGVVAAVQAARMGKRVALVCQDNHIGGLSSGGLGWTDIGPRGNSYVGGIAREFYQRNGARYRQAVRFNLEPHVAEQIFGELLVETGVRVFFNRRLASVTMAGRRITQAVMDDGAVYRGKMFVDTTYEGDLMASAGVSFTMGREGTTTYGESLAGIRTPVDLGIDPYVEPDNPASGLLPLLQPGDGGTVGAGDHRVQTYCYRLAFSQTAANRLPVLPPQNYDPNRFELLARYIESLVARKGSVALGDFMTLDRPFATGKYDINNNNYVSINPLGESWTWGTNSYAGRAVIRKKHEDYMRGFFTFLASSPRVPSNVRTAMQTWGLCQDEFLDTGGWPHALYIREARRMVGDYVMLQQDCMGGRVAPDGIALGVYWVDSHDMQYIAKNGRAHIEGGLWATPPGPFPISFRSIVPRAGECENVLCTFALSASHVAFGSCRMEPVFMITSQSAATAAALAIDANQAVQDVPYARLKERLAADKQVLQYTAPAKKKGKSASAGSDNTPNRKVNP